MLTTISRLKNGRVFEVNPVIWSIYYDFEICDCMLTTISRVGGLTFSGVRRMGILQIDNNIKGEDVGFLL